jgi:hypothetical protein
MAVSVVGAVSLEQAEEAIASGKVDMVALCRQPMADPETVNKLQRGWKDEIRPCIRCNTCISRSHYGPFEWSVVTKTSGWKLAQKRRRSLLPKKEPLRCLESNWDEVLRRSMDIPYSTSLLLR